MTAEIIEFKQFRKCRAATGPDTFQGVRLPPMVPANLNEMILSDAELTELQSIFPMDGIKPVTQRALYSEAAEQAYVEANNGPIDLSSFPAYSTEDFIRDRAIKIRQVRLMVDRTAKLLREYLAAYRSVR